IREGEAGALGLSPAQARRIMSAAGTPVRIERPSAGAMAVEIDGGRVRLAEVTLTEAREAAPKVYLLVVILILTIYAVIALFLEMFVLPQHVYGPIRRTLEADRAVQRGDRAREIVADELIPRDELGEIMRSRNASVLALRRREGELADALDRLERVASDLKRKNHLLENARRSLEGADRLASLGMLSAGIAHEINTPLAVVKGLADRLVEGEQLSASQTQLLARVVGRLERLSEGLTDFARARPPHYAACNLREVAREAATLVRLDRRVGRSAIEVDIPDDLVIDADADRLVQVFVNLIRNAVDATRTGEPRIRVEASLFERDDCPWVSARVLDHGPGIEPEVLPSLFEPFVSTRLDAKGTGLGLAVAEGIVREHLGTIIAQNRTDGPGAAFEVMLPARQAEQASVAEDQPSESPTA
ncbi:MAG: ATP-binding protein, partial [Planctomycetota bacterium]